MKLWTQPLGPVQTNGFVLSNEQGDGIVIDPGMEPEELLETIEGLNIKAILLTHAHFDHIGGLTQVMEQTQAPVYIHAQEAEWLTTPELNGSARWPMVTEPMVFDVDVQPLTDGQKLKLAGWEIDVFHVPGHSPGSVVFYIPEEQIVIAGDTLFAGSIGRTDLPGGDYDQLIHNISTKLLVLPEETTVYPGHGPHTTIKKEKQFNPFVGQL